MLPSVRAVPIKRDPRPIETSTAGSGKFYGISTGVGMRSFPGSSSYQPLNTNERSEDQGDNSNKGDGGKLRLPVDL
jgi:hypothetical protein